MVEKLYGHEMEGHNKALWAIRSLYPGNADLAKENLHKTAQVFRGNRSSSINIHITDALFKRLPSWESDYFKQKGF